MKFGYGPSLAGFAQCLIAGSALAQITLYGNDNFGGRTFRSAAAVASLDNTGFNDKASSVIISGGANWEFANPYRAAEPARFKDLGNNAVFRWSDYRLEVDEGL
jgi:hypothetical protein